MSDVKRGCPNCGCKDTAVLTIDASFESCSGFKVSPWYALGYQIHPAICLTCGTIYVDSTTLNAINSNLKKAGHNV